MKTQLPPCDHDECPKTHCIRPTDPTKLCAAGPTPQSDQAATTPEKAVEWLNLTSHMLQYGYEMGEGRCSIDVADRITMRQIAALLRAQSSELLALRAALRGADFELRCYLPVLANAEDNPETWERITRGTGIATTNGIRHTLGKIDAALNSPTQGAK